MTWPEGGVYSPYFKAANLLSLFILQTICSAALDVRSSQNSHGTSFGGLKKANVNRNHHLLEEKYFRCTHQKAVIIDNR